MQSNYVWQLFKKTILCTLSHFQKLYFMRFIRQFDLIFLVPDKPLFSGALCNGEAIGRKRVNFGIQSQHGGRSDPIPTSLTDFYIAPR